MSEARLPQAPARNTPDASPPDVIAERIEEELDRLRHARPILDARIDRATQIVVVQLSSAACNRPIRCRVRRGGKRVALVSSLTAGGVTYEVDPHSWRCNCPDAHRAGTGCKHGIAAWALWRSSLPREVADHVERVQEVNARVQRESACSDCGERFPADRLIEAQEGQAVETLNPGDLVCRLCAPRHGLRPAPSHQPTQEAAHDEEEGCDACHGTGWVHLAEDVTDPKSGETGKAHNPVRCRSCKPATPPHLTDEEMQAWMDGSRWIWARTMEKTHPHEYALKRHQKDEELFERVVRTIWDRGYDRPYLRRVWRSLDVGEHYIWIAGAPPKPEHTAPVETTTLINRALRVQERLGTGA